MSAPKPHACDEYSKRSLACSERHFEDRHVKCGDFFEAYRECLRNQVWRCRSARAAARHSRHHALRRRVWHRFGSQKRKAAARHFAKVDADAKRG